MKFTKANAKKFGWKGLKGWAYSSKYDFPRASVAYFEVSGTHGKVKTTKSDRIYFVMEGTGTFILANKKIPVKKTDVVIIPKNTVYDYRTKKTMKLLLVHSPSFDPNAEKKME